MKNFMNDSSMILTYIDKAKSLLLNKAWQKITLLNSCKIVTVIDDREDAYSRTGGIFIRDTMDTALDTAYSLWFNVA